MTRFFENLFETLNRKGEKTTDPNPELINDSKKTGTHLCTNFPKEEFQKSLKKIFQETLSNNTITHRETDQIIQAYKKFCIRLLTADNYPEKPLHDLLDQEKSMDLKVRENIWKLKDILKDNSQIQEFILEFKEEREKFKNQMERKYGSTQREHIQSEAAKLGHYIVCLIEDFIEHTGNGYLSDKQRTKPLEAYIPEAGRNREAVETLLLSPNLQRAMKEFLSTRNTQTARESLKNPNKPEKKENNLSIKDILNLFEYDKALLRFVKSAIALDINKKHLPSNSEIS